MKGIIFNSFIEFAEQNFGMEFVDEMLDKKAFSSAGAYTAVGTYPSDELLDMVAYIHEVHKIDIPTMSRQFGEFTFGILVDRYTHLVSEYSNAIECLCHVDQTIHKNVKKLYPDAELPNMDARLDSTGQVLDMVYQSSRPLMHVAHGLILGCVAHFGDSVTIQMTDLSNGTGKHARFTLTRND